MGRRAGTGHEAIQQRGGLIADALGIGRNAAHRWIGKVAKELIIVDADHRDLIGHQNTGAVARLEHLKSPIIIASHQTHRLR